VDVTGARALSRRIAQQEHWRQARAVRVGQQPASDPDGQELESFRSGLRLYRAEQRLEDANGRRELVTLRFCKRLIDGAWHDEVIVESVRAA
jgi:hypothetical protein